MSDSAQSWAEKDVEALLQVKSAVKLLEFFEEMLRSQEQKINVFEMAKKLEASSKLRSLSKVEVEWMQEWIQERMESSWAVPIESW